MNNDDLLTRGVTSSYGGITITHSVIATTITVDFRDRPDLRVTSHAGTILTVQQDGRTVELTSDIERRAERLIDMARDTMTDDESPLRISAGAGTISDGVPVVTEENEYSPLLASSIGLSNAIRNSGQER